MSDVMVKVEDLSIRYQVLADRQQSMIGLLARAGRQREARVVDALKGISFEVHQGDAVGLVGHNGSGKTTLLQAIAGFLPPSRGQVLVRHQPQMLGVQAALNPQISGRTNVRMGCLALGLTQHEVGAIVPEVVEFSELGDFIDMPVETYSAGMKQRLAFAISTVTRPDILLIDEALAVGDRTFKQRSLERLRGLRDTAGAVILATHAMDEVRSSCNKVLWLHEGQIRMFGSTDQVVDQFLKFRGAVERRVQPAKPPKALRAIGLSCQHRCK